jgi:hypothetical protein
VPFDPRCCATPLAWKSGTILSATEARTELRTDNGPESFMALSLPERSSSARRLGSTVGELLSEEEARPDDQRTRVCFECVAARQG